MKDSRKELLEHTQVPGVKLQDHVTTGTMSAQCSALVSVSV